VSAEIAVVSPLIKSRFTRSNHKALRKGIGSEEMSKPSRCQWTDDLRTLHDARVLDATCFASLPKSKSSVCKNTKDELPCVVAVLVSDLNDK
jgi:hypothetical protein